MVVASQEGQQAEAVARRMYELFGAGDLQTVLDEVIAQDAVFHAPGSACVPQPLFGTFKGREEIEQHFTTGPSLFDYEPVQLQFVGAGGRSELGGILVTVLGSCNIRKKGSSDAWRTFEFCQMLTIRDGRVHHMHEYCDSHLLAQALAGAPPEPAPSET